MSLEYLREAREGFQRKLAERRNLYKNIDEKLGREKREGASSSLHSIIVIVSELLRASKWESLLAYLSEGGIDGQRTHDQYDSFVAETREIGLTRHLFEMNENSSTRRCLLSCVCWCRATPTHVEIAKLLLTRFGACPNGNAVPISGPTHPQVQAEGSVTSPECAEEHTDDPSSHQLDEEFSLFSFVTTSDTPTKPRLSVFGSARPSFPIASLGGVRNTGTSHINHDDDLEQQAYISTTPLHCVFTMELSHLDNIRHSGELWDLLVSHGAHVDPFDPSPNATRQTPLITAIQAANSNGPHASLSLIFGVSNTCQGHECGDDDSPSETSVKYDPEVTDCNGFIRWWAYTSANRMFSRGLGGDTSGRNRVIQRYHCLLAVGANVNSFTPPSRDDPALSEEQGLKALRATVLASKNPLAQCIYIGNQRLTDLRPSYIRDMLNTALQRRGRANGNTAAHDASTINLEQLDHPVDDYDRTAAAKALLDCGADILSVAALCGDACENVASASLRELLILEGIDVQS